MVDAAGVDEDDVVYVLRYFHSVKFVSSPKFDYVNWKVDRLQVDPNRLCYWDIICNVYAFGYLKKSKFVYYRIHAVIFNTAALVLEHDDTLSNVVGSSYDHVVGQDHVDVGSQVEDGGSDAENGPKHVEVGPEDHVDVGADHVDVDDDGNRANHVDVEPVSENGSQHAENRPDSDNGLDQVVVGPKVDDVEPELGDDRSELADNETTDDSGAEDGVDGSEEDAFLFNIDIGSDVDEELEDIREKGRGKRHKEKAADREGQPVQPYNLDEGNRSSDKDGKLEGYETDYISSSDPGEYEDSLRFDDNEQFKEAVRKYAFAKGVQLKIVKNEQNRTRLHCMKGCPWTLFASTDKKLRCYIVKTYNHVHKCYMTNKNKLISAKYIQKQFKDIILANPKMKVKTLKEMYKRELGVYASFNMCQRTRKQVIKEFRESYVEEYASLWGLTYIEEFDDNLQKLENLGPTSIEDLLQNPGTTQNVALSTTGPPGMVHGSTQNVASATTGPPGMSSNQNVASASTVAPTTQPKPIKKTYKKKAQVDIGLYTDIKTGDQIWNPGTSTERVVTRASKRKIGKTDPFQFQHHSKGKGLCWKENTDVTTRQLQENVETVRKKRGRPPKSQTLGTQSSQT
ncbi:hypothetical protein V6N11_060805 [Hibiscus sabdariffa]|uniref:Transposase MuDR plant domain-containing protein n=1 Tax=Hibiscus sabdariffa TaxID=183260 RepID=A0ABR2QRC6_9ROSI